jgi:hypothetical protein
MIIVGGMLVSSLFEFMQSRFLRERLNFNLSYGDTQTNRQTKTDGNR